MDCESSDVSDFGPLDVGSLWDCDFDLAEVDDPTEAYDLTGLVARLRVRQSSFNGTVLHDSRSDDAEPTVFIASPATSGVVQVRLPGTISAEWVPGSRLHVEIDLIDPNDDPVEPELTVAGYVTARGKSNVEAAA